MLDVSKADPLSGFCDPQPYTPEVIVDAPSAAGVHVVLDGATVVYAGWTGNLRRRLRQHLTGNRGSSVLHDQIGQLLDPPGGTATATAAEIAQWLGRCTVRWRVSENPEAEKDAIVRATAPCFNRKIPKPRRPAPTPR
jgi:hypothetical protein